MCDERINICGRSGEASPSAGIRRFFEPEAIAVIGASPHAHHVTGRPVRLLKAKRFPGRIYPVNPRCDEIMGLRAYPDVEALPEVPDVALILVSASRAPEAVEACARKGIPFVAVFAAGFSEVGPRGQALEHRLRDAVRSTRTRIVGPNCYGSMNVIGGVPLGFASALGMDAYPVGSVGFYSQSGAFVFGFLTLGMEEGLGFSYVLNGGNAVDVDACDMLEFLAADADTEIAAAYLEDCPDLERLEKAVGRCRKAGKPVVILAAGGTALGQKAARAHTAAGGLGGAEAELIAGWPGVHMPADADEMLDVLVGLSVRSGRTPRWEGDGVAVVTTSGALGVLFADAADRLGLALPPPGDEVARRLDRILPAYASTQNPIDTSAMVVVHPELVIRILDVLREDPSYACVVLMLSTPTGDLGEELPRRLTSALEDFEKPVVVVVTGGRETTSHFCRGIREAGLPLFQAPHRAARAIAAAMPSRTRDGRPGVSRLADGPRP